MSNQYDYIVVGAGSAGCVVASRLSEDASVRILLLEAGPTDRKREISIPIAFPKLFQSDVDWAYWTEPEPQLENRRIFWPRGRTLGGSSSLNAQIFQRGHPDDFNTWSRQGNAGWSFDDVLPFFRRLENNQAGVSDLRSRGGPLNVAPPRGPRPLSRVFLAAAEASGIPLNPDFNGPQLEGAGLFQLTQKRGKRHSAASAYLRPALKRGNLTVETEARATRVRLENGRAIGITYVQGKTQKQVTASREIILSSGAVNTPHLLMVSGIGPPGELENVNIKVRHPLEGVGQNLQDHLVVITLYQSTRPVSLLGADSFWELLRFILLGRGKLTSNIAEAGAFVCSSAAALPDLELVFAPVLFLEQGLKEPASHGFGIGVVHLQPESRGKIGLADADPLQLPRIHPLYLSDPKGNDLRVLREGLSLARQVLRAPAFDPFRGAELAPGEGVRSPAALEGFIRRAAHTIYHPAGTCRMGGDSAAVVDAELKVRGLSGLRVVDASIFPTLVRGHPNAAVIMLAEKAAEMIRSQS